MLNYFNKIKYDANMENDMERELIIRDYLARQRIAFLFLDIQDYSI